MNLLFHKFYIITSFFKMCAQEILAEVDFKTVGAFALTENLYIKQRSYKNE